MRAAQRRARVRLTALLVSLAMAMPAVTLAVVVGRSGTPPDDAPGQLDVSGALTQDTTWAAADGPVEVTGQLVVQAGATLTIEPGVEVRVAPRIDIVVYGSLIAEGTAESPIRILGAVEEPGSWLGLSFIGGVGNPVRAVLRHAEIAHGGGPGGRGAQVYAYGGSLDLGDAEIRDGAADGVVVESGALVANRTTIRRNVGEALVLLGLSTALPSSMPELADLRLEANGLDGIVVEGHGAIDTSVTWPDLGYPYSIRGQVIVEPDGALTIEPGVEIRFGREGELWVRGQLLALGLADAPIVLRGESEGPAAWLGLALIGGATPATARLEHVELRHAGGRDRPAITVTNGILDFSDGTLADVAADGILVNGTLFGTTRVEGSRLIGIGGDGIVNETTGLVLATADWWGSPSGPSTDDGCRPSDGTRIRGQVRFVPWLTSADEQRDPLAPSGVPTITVTPQRWYAPADGQTRVWVDLTLLDPDGRPLPGRTIELLSTAGIVTSGGLTDAAGHTLAYLTADAPGDAVLTAVLDGSDPCELVDGTEAIVTFTDDGDGLIAGMQAPYLFEGIRVTPEPIIRGVPTTISATLLNPNATAITVEVEFGLADFGIALAFGPIGAPQTVEIPAGGEVVVETTFTPVVSGHYCVDVRYRVVGGSADARWGPPIAGAMGPMPADDWRPTANGGSGGGRLNLSVYGGPLGGGGGSGSGGGSGGCGKGSKCPLDRAQKAGDAMGNLGSIGTGETFIPGVAAGLLTHWQISKAAEIDRQLGGDPPRQDYDLIAVPERRSLDLGDRPDGMSDARWAAIVDLIEALEDHNAIGEAATISLDRYGGAAAAQDLRWASVQAASLLHYRRSLADASIAVADALARFGEVLDAEGLGTASMTEAEAAAALEAFRTRGFSTDDLAVARRIGLDDAAIERIRQAQLAVEPASLAKSYRERVADAEAAFRALRSYFEAPLNFPSERGATAALPGSAAEHPVADLARIYDQTATFKLENPLDTTAVIELRVRPISLPAGWPVVVSPSSVTLEPGEQTMISVTVSPSGPTPQGAIVRVGVEGFVGQELLGGVVIGLVVPEDVPFEVPEGPAEAPIALIVSVVLLVVVAAAGSFWYLRRRRGTG